METDNWTENFNSISKNALKSTFAWLLFFLFSKCWMSISLIAIVTEFKLNWWEFLSPGSFFQGDTYLQKLLRLRALAGYSSAIEQLRRSSKELDLIIDLLSYQSYNTEPKAASKERVTASPSHLLTEFDLNFFLRQPTFQCLYVDHRTNLFHIRSFYLSKRDHMFIHFSEERLIGMLLETQGQPTEDRFCGSGFL